MQFSTLLALCLATLGAAENITLGFNDGTNSSVEAAPCACATFTAPLISLTIPRSFSIVLFDGDDCSHNRVTTFGPGQHVLSKPVEGKSAQVLQRFQPIPCV
ncbi:hypothetical protein PT974_07819 [Cladobotryum mycophilum]|uniref:Uncharacterized protein n=1 Tax=Cladobotryum mycophilum TaxID=491253 RepID=A0ABR0SJ51_9HYPO